ncbi:MAG: AAA family ATPase [Gammaproteobacteria bacterium]|nr:AAA family ATPase [Gammaproteobacteria bacterium]NNJ94814.1 AAA family ATPase [Halobacteria archaeon]
MITVIANLKGGSGKSTVAFNLAIWLVKQGRRVVGYDLDPQCTFSDLGMLRDEIGVRPNLEIHSVRAVLRDQLLSHTDCEVLVDVGAANMAAMKEAMTSADRILVPVPPSQADVWATQRFLHIIGPDTEAMKFNGNQHTIAFINRADTNKSIRETHETEEALRTLPGIDMVMPQRLRMRTSFRRSLSEGLAVFEMWPGSKAAGEFGSFAHALYPDIAANQN